MIKDKSKLRKPDWRNLMASWQDFPYDKSQVEEYRDSLHKLFDTVVAEKDIREYGKTLVDKLAERAFFFMDKTHSDSNI